MCEGPHSGTETRCGKRSDLEMKLSGLRKAASGSATASGKDLRSLSLSGPVSWCLQGNRILTLNHYWGIT